ncbi:MAG TPA: peptidoglycan DD-metalloendopeptidase family protein [Candidatus Binatia bacterium]
MALKRGAAIAMCLLALALSMPAAAQTAPPKTDFRLERAKKIRDEIMQKRARALQPAKPVIQRDPVEDALTDARSHVADLDAQIDNNHHRSETNAAPRDKLAARADELESEKTKIDERNRARIDAVYRSAKLGAGAAGWSPDPAATRRLSRYLASISGTQSGALQKIQVEQGSVIASLDRSRADEAAIAAELRDLEAARTEAQAALDRAQAAVDARAGGGGGEAEEAANDDEQRAADDGAGDDRAPSGNAAGRDEAAATMERAIASAAAARTRAGTADAAGHNGADFTWLNGEARDAGAPADGGTSLEDARRKLLAPAGEAPAAPADSAQSAREKAALEKAAQARAALDRLSAQRANQDREPVAGAAVAAGPAASAGPAAQPLPPPAVATGKQSPPSAGPAASKPAAEDTRMASVPAKPAAPPAADIRSDAANPEVDEGPAVLAPSGAPPAAAPPPDNAAAPPKRGLLSRLFGGDDRESDKFAAARGTLAAPVAGKVVASYGQQHKSGAVYHGVILRATYDAPIKAVADGRVSFVGQVPGMGNTVIVSHGNRYHTVYARLGTVRVKDGDRVSAGTEVGALPDDDADMHFELRDKGQPIDPMPWLKAGVPGSAP